MCRGKSCCRGMSEVSAVWTGLSRAVVVICAAFFSIQAARVRYIIDDSLSDDCNCVCNYALHPMDSLKFIFTTDLLAIINVLFLKSWILETDPSRFYLYFVQYTVPIMSLHAHRHSNLTDSFVKDSVSMRFVKLRVKNQQNENEVSNQGDVMCTEDDEPDAKQLNWQKGEVLGALLRESMYGLALLQALAVFFFTPSIYVDTQFVDIWKLPGWVSTFVTYTLIGTGFVLPFLIRCIGGRVFGKVFLYWSALNVFKDDL